MSTNTKDTNPKTAAATARLDLSLVPDTSVIYEALAFTEGDLKYGGYNYREKGVSISTYIAACRRHIGKYYNGEWADPKTGVPHLANAKACLGVIIDAHECKVLNDDRPPHCDVSGLLDDMEKAVSHLQDIFPNPPGRCKSNDA